MIPYEQQLAGSFDTVLKEADALYGPDSRLKRTYERLSLRLNARGIFHTLVGGYALILHGVRRFTEDIDVLVRPHDLALLRDEMIGRGYTEIPGNARSIRDAETGVRIDFVVTGQFPGDGKAKPLSFPDPESAGEMREGIRVVGLTTLVELKLASGMTGKGRLQDLADVQRLIQAHRLDETFAGKLHPYVRERFQELWAQSS